MTPEKWQRIKVVLAGAFEREGRERSVYLDDACASDADLRAEVESLITAEAGHVDLDDDHRERLAPGTRIGPFEVIDLIGVGGMGEVYRAHDTRLGRDVALKVLPASLAGEAEPLRRLRDEARVLASLVHPNVAAIHGLEETPVANALVLELVDGETLAERLRRGPLPLAEALAVAREMSLGLEAAHEKGIAHRDLKPDNIKLTAKNTVKLLDFGLAKAFERRPEPAGPHTARYVLGTAAYMAPEQARGAAVDQRCDIWSFGVVLWEMLTGRRLFARTSWADTIGAVLSERPDWAALPARTPSSARRLLQRCLEPDPANRLHHIADARLELDEALRSGPPEEPSPARRRTRALPLVLGAFAVGAVVAGALTLSSRRPAAARASHLTIADAGFVRFSGAAISPDGRRIVYPQLAETQPLLLRTLDHPVPREVAGTGGARNPFFSPDGAWVAFFRDRSLWKTKLCTDGPADKPCGGEPQRICETGPWTPLGFATGHWPEAGTIVLSHAVIGGHLWPGLARVRDGGASAPEPITTVDASRSERFHMLPEQLPGRRWVVFAIQLTQGFRVETAALDGSERRVLVEGASAPRYSPSGHLLVFRPNGNIVQAMAFDAERALVKGAPVTVLSDVLGGSYAGVGGFALSSTGTLIYSDQVDDASRQREVVHIGRDGRASPLLSEVRAWSQPRLSPDGRLLLIRTLGTSTCDLWLYDLRRETLTRLLTGGDDHDPVWDPGATRIAFSSGRPGGRTIQVREVFRSGSGETISKGEGDRIAPHFSADGRHVVFTVAGSAGYDLHVRDVREDEERVLLATEFDEDEAAFSADGRWLALASNQTGRREVYIRSFTGSGRMIQVSSAGGRSPLWSRGGRELFFLDADSEKLMSVSVGPGDPPELGSPRVVFAAGFVKSRETRPYDVSADGRRFVVVRQVQSDAMRRQLHVVLDWSNEIERSVPR